MNCASSDAAWEELRTQSEHEVGSGNQHNRW